MKRILASAVGTSVWDGTAISVDGSFTALPVVPATAASGSYTVRVAAGDLTVSAPFTVDSSG